MQSRAQLRQRWGDTGAAAIMNNAATLMIYGGTRDPDDLDAYSTLTGERDEEVPTLRLGGPGHRAGLPARAGAVARADRPAPGSSAW